MEGNHLSLFPHEKSYMDSDIIPSSFSHYLLLKTPKIVQGPKSYKIS